MIIFTALLLLLFTIKDEKGAIVVNENIISEDNIHLYQEWERLEEEVENATSETLTKRKKSLDDFLEKHPGLPAEKKQGRS